MSNSFFKIPVGSSLDFFMRTFLPSFSKSLVTDQIQLAISELESKTLPPYKSCTDKEYGFRGNNPFKAPWNQMINRNIMESNIELNNREFKFKPMNSIEVIYCVLETLGSKLKYLDDLVKQSFEDDIVNSQLSYLQLNLLRLAEMSEFYLVYARKLLIMLVHNEYKQLSTKVEGTEPLVKGDVKWLEDNLITFTSMTRIYSQNKENFIRAIKSIPELTVSEDKSETALAQKVHGKNLDPMQMGFIPYVFNPIYHVRNLTLLWRHSRIEAAKQEKEYIELRLQQYRMKLDGKDNAKMERVIANTEERLKRLNKKIVEMEDSYAADYGA